MINKIKRFFKTSDDLQFISYLNLFVIVIAISSIFIKDTTIVLWLFLLQFYVLTFSFAYGSGYFKGRKTGMDEVAKIYEDVFAQRTKTLDQIGRHIEVASSILQKENNNGLH